MLKISRLADYAILLLWQFTNIKQRDASHAPLNVNYLAEKTSLPVPTIAKVLKLLHHDGLLISKRGAHGGYLLARSPNDISLAHILKAIEGPIHLTNCVSDDDSCNILNLCPLSNVWNEVHQKFEDILDETSLAQLQPKLSFHYEAISHK